MKKIIAKIKKDSIIHKVIVFANKNFKEAQLYLVGGALRDFYLNKENSDKDLVVINTNTEVFAENLAKELNATYIKLDEENKIYRLVLKDKINYIDIAAPVGKNIEEDLKRRDLTINSIALNLKTLEIIDINNGLNDLKTKKIKPISEKNFIDDPLRILRVYRFFSTLAFQIDNKMTVIVKKHCKRIHDVSVERINYELLKLFSGENSSQSLLEMDKAGLLKELFPIINEVKKVPPNLHHHLDLFNHSIETVKQIQILYESNTPEIKEHLEKIDFGGINRLAHLKLAAFLHDIGKPETWFIEADTGKHRFIKHDDIGAKLASKILKKSKFSKKQIDYITKMIKYHIYPSHVVTTPDINEKIYMRLIRKMGNEVIDIIILAMADRLSARGVEITDEIVERNLNKLQTLLDFYLNIKDSLKPLPKLLSGEEIMNILNITPSKELGDIIKKLNEAQLSGEITTKNEALNFIESI